MEDWSEVRLDEVVQFQRGHDLTIANIKNGPYPVCGSNGVIGYHNEYTTEGPGLTLGRSGNSIGVVHYYKSRFWAHNTTLYSTSFNNSEPLYLYYALSKIDFASLNSGSAVPSLNRNHIHNLRLKVPHINEQRAIAALLSCLDDKIDLLHRQNKTLEALAETLFRQWFVEEAHDDWEEGTLGEVIEIFDGKRIPLSKMERDQRKDGQLYPYYGAAKIMDYVNDYIFDGEYILLGEDGTVRTDEGLPVLQFATGKFWVNNHAHVIKAKPPYSNFFLWKYLSRTNIDQIVTGAVQPKINQGNLRALSFPRFPVEIVQTFSSITEPLRGRISQNEQSIKNLEALRDTLLPKLMSGEVRVHYE